MHSKLLEPAWRWTIKAMVKAGLLPGIGHYELHLRDRLCDAVRGTPLASMRRLQGWQRVDQSKEPTVPRGIVEGLFDHSFVDEESRRTGPAQEPHSSLAAPGWFRGQTGHDVPSALRSRADMQSVLPHAATMHTDGNGDSRVDGDGIDMAAGRPSSDRPSSVDWHVGVGPISTGAGISLQTRW